MSKEEPFVTNAAEFPPVRLDFRAIPKIKHTDPNFSEYEQQKWFQRAGKSVTIE